MIQQDGFMSRRDNYFGGAFSGDHNDGGNTGPIGRYQAPGSGSTNPYNPQGAPRTISYNQNSDAEDLNASLIRAEYDDYRRRYLPLEKELMRLALDPEEKRKAVKRAGLDVEKGFNSAAQQSSMQAQRYGIRDPSLQVGVNKSRDLARTSAIAKAKNETRTAQDDLTMKILSGSSNNSGNSRLSGG